jgi:tetratricopeptide (TPR) repeat protein
MKISKSNKKVLVSQELINKKNYFLFNCGSFRIFYSTFTKRSDFKKNAAYAAFFFFLNRTALLKLNKPQEALEDFDRAIIVYVHSGVWYQNRSLAYRALGKIKEADADLATANKLLSEE